MWHYQGNTLYNLPKILIYFKKSALFSLPSSQRERKQKTTLRPLRLGENNLISKLR